MPSYVPPLPRRRFLKVTAASLTALMAGGWPTLASAVPPTGKRRLLVLEMNGGNDGLNTLIPYGDGHYYDLRPNLGIRPADVLPLTNGYGLHPSLKYLHRRFGSGKFALVQGVGYARSDLSHFAMMDVWRAGHSRGAAATEQTGWLGRLLDQLAGGTGQLSGLSLASQASPILLARTATVGAFADVPSGGLSGLSLVDVPQMLHLTAATYPKTESGTLLKLASTVLKASPSVRVVHIPLPLDFDTHARQASRMSRNLLELDEALEAFFADLGDQANDTLVMTVSEFGRRAVENRDRGTDHGTANTLMLLGTGIKPGIHGDPPSLAELDADGNLRSTSSYLDVLASVVEGWMRVPAREVVAEGVSLGFFA